MDFEPVGAPCHDPEAHRLAADATARSREICELCGAAGLLREHHGWSKTTCADCATRIADEASCGRRGRH
jgi:hypothetical protein